MKTSRKAKPNAMALEGVSLVYSGKSIERTCGAETQDQHVSRWLSEKDYAGEKGSMPIIKLEIHRARTGPESERHDTIADKPNIRVGPDRYEPAINNLEQCLISARL